MWADMVESRSGVPRDDYTRGLVEQWQAAGFSEERFDSHEILLVPVSALNERIWWCEGCDEWRDYPPSKYCEDRSHSFTVYFLLKGAE